MDVLDERQISEFEMEKGGFRIRIKRTDGQAETPSAPLYVNNQPLPRRAAPPLELPETGPVPAMPAPSEAGEAPEDVHLVKSPIVGTYYSAPSPSAPPFVQVGDEVQVGQALCIIEAMKLMNEIESDVAGEVVRVYAEASSSAGVDRLLRKGRQLLESA